MSEFIEHILDNKEPFQSLIKEEQLVTRTVLQDSLDIVDRTATAVVMHKVSWLHSTAVLKQLQATIEDLSFDKANSLLRKRTRLCTP